MLRVYEIWEVALVLFHLLIKSEEAINQAKAGQTVQVANEQVTLFGKRTEVTISVKLQPESVKPVEITTTGEATPIVANPVASEPVTSTGENFQ